MPSIELGSVDIIPHDHYDRYTVYYEAQIRRLGPHDDLPFPSPEGQPDWFPRPAHFALKLVMNSQTRAADCAATLSYCLAAAPIWRTLGYACSPSASVEIDGSLHLDLRLTDHFTVLSDDIKTNSKPSTRIYRETVTNGIEAPSGVITSLLDNVTLYINSHSLTPSSLQRHDSLFGEPHSEDSTTTELDVECVLKVIDLAIRTSICPNPINSDASLEVSVGEDFCPLVSFSPAIWKPDAYRAFAMNAVFMPCLGKILQNPSGSPSNPQRNRGNVSKPLWCLLYHKLLVDGPSPRLDAIELLAVPPDFESREADDDMLFDDESVHCSSTGDCIDGEDLLMDMDEEDIDWEGCFPEDTDDQDIDWEANAPDNMYV